jgi:hypothetical protein
LKFAFDNSANLQTKAFWRTSVNPQDAAIKRMRLQNGSVLSLKVAMNTHQ